ncbi:MAG: hypothetical protein ACTS3F_00410 [Phycisphaerales bacterium]
MARIEITNEREAGAGWAFDVVIAGGVVSDSSGPGGGDTAEGAAGRTATGTGTRHEVRLSWADYEYWSHGTRPPAWVVEVVLGFVLSREDGVQELRPSLDLGRVRRRWSGVDAWVDERV